MNTKQRGAGVKATSLSATSLEVAAALAPMLARIAPLADSVRLDQWQVTVQGRGDSLNALIESLGLKFSRHHDDQVGNRYTSFDGYGFAPWQGVEVRAVVVTASPFMAEDCDSADHEAVSL